ncbi:MAG TPA: hypothetical protein VMT56_03095 [Candidatus Bathyarchaeia archaeon]|nr:hypothetical protein [Candidatus Bathyarchaeia archaeon]
MSGSVTNPDVLRKSKPHRNGTTVTVTVVLTVWPPPVADTTRLYVPKGVELLTATSKREDPEPGAVIVAGFNTAVLPVGAPETDSVMSLLKLGPTVVVMVVLPLVANGTVMDAGEADIAIPDASLDMSVPDAADAGGATMTHAAMTAITKRA